jgi:hypothetical protein
MRLVRSFVSKMVSIWSSLSSGSYRVAAPPLEAFDPASLHGWPVDAGVCGMTVRAHLEHERLAKGAGGEFSSTCAAAHLGQY